MEWISIDERLPSGDFDGVPVIVAVINHCGSRIPETDVWLTGLQGGRFDFWKDKVTHWMPLPPAPSA